MKILVLTLLLTIAVAFAIPVDSDADDGSQLTLVDVDSDQPLDNTAPIGTRSKRFILKKIVLAKAGLLGVGALGLAGAVAAKSAIGIGGIGLGGMGGLGGIGGGNGGAQPPQPYGPSYNYGNVPTTVQAAPPSYYPSQAYVPQQVQQVPVQQVQSVQHIQPVQQPIYGQPIYGQSSGGPLSAAIAWKSGLVSGITNSLSNGFGGQFRSPIAAAPPAYTYQQYPAVVSAPLAQPAYSESVQVAPIAPAAQIAPSQIQQPVPNKPLYVVCDNNNN